MSPGSGDLPVGQLDAQTLLPNGSGMPSFASSWLTRAEANVYPSEVSTWGATLE